MASPHPTTSRRSRFWLSSMTDQSPSFFQAEDVLFKVPAASVLAKEYTVIRGMLQGAQWHMPLDEGLSEDRPIFLPGSTAGELEIFLTAILKPEKLKVSDSASPPTGQAALLAHTAQLGVDSFITAFRTTPPIPSHLSAISHLGPWFTLIKVADYFDAPRIATNAARVITMDDQFSMMPIHQKLRLAINMKVQPWLEEAWLTLVRSPSSGEDEDVMSDEICALLPSRAVKLLFLYRARIFSHLREISYNLLTFLPIRNALPDACLVDPIQDFPCEDQWPPIMNDSILRHILCNDDRFVSASAIFDDLLDRADERLCRVCEAKLHIAVAQSKLLMGRRQVASEVEGFADFCAAVIPNPLIGSDIF